jgi:hypothetical protein
LSAKVVVIYNNFLGHITIQNFGGFHEVILIAHFIFICIVGRLVKKYARNARSGKLIGI